MGETAADMANTLAEGNYLLYNRYVRDTDPAEVLSLYGQQRFDLAEKYLDYELIDSKDEVIASDLPEEEQEKLHEDGKEYAFRVKYIFSENGDLEDIQIGGTAFGAEEAYNMESIYINEVKASSLTGRYQALQRLRMLRSFTDNRRKSGSLWEYHCFGKRRISRVLQYQLYNGFQRYA